MKTKILLIILAVFSKAVSKSLIANENDSKREGKLNIQASSSE
jgi:hypothetical protein